MKHLIQFESFTSQQVGGNDKIINKINTYLSNPKFIKIIDKLPKFAKKAISKYVNQNSIDLDIIKNNMEKYNIYDRVKKIYDSGVRDINTLIDKIFKPSMKSEAVGFLGAIGIMLVVIILTFLFFLGVFYVLPFSKDDPVGPALFSSFGATLLIGMVLLKEVKPEAFKDDTQKTSQELNSTEKVESEEKKTEILKYEGTEKKIILIPNENDTYKIKEVEE